MFQDCDDMPSEFYSESPDSDKLEMCFSFLDLDDHEREIIEAYPDCLDNPDDIRACIDNFYGSYDDRAEFAQEMTEGCYNVPDHLAFYIDYDAMGRDYLMDYSWTEHNGQLWVWRY
jgi:antirestriction protein